MKQFAVYENIYEETREDYPYYLNVQDPLHERLESRMVVPLSQKTKSIQGLSPILNIHENKYIAVIPEMFAVPLVYMGNEVTDLSMESSTIINAIDLLITGF